MAVDSRHQQALGPIPSYAADPMRYGSQVSQPQFNNPWVSAAASASPIYASAQAGNQTLDTPAQIHRQTGLSLPGYSTLPLSATTLAPGASLMAATAYAHPTTLQPPQDMVSSRFPQFSAAPPSSYPAQAPGFSLDLHDARNSYNYASDVRRPSHPFSNTSQAERESFGEVIDASRQIISLSQSDITPTPRNMYGDQSSRSSPESYGFPAQHSAHSSISSASGMHSNYGGSSVGDYSLSDYSSASESVDANHRTLPRPQAINNGIPPPPQSMMNQFSSKVSSSSQKKHKCKVCDKRFTRPSSLQTHIYSHTGEKPFACEVEGCGRHFSVVSNLRRHKKVHKNQGRDSMSVTTNEE